MSQLVSILVNCYNCDRYLSEALDSIYAQTYTNWEVIFIDNCSTDNSKTIVDQYDERTKYYNTPENISLCAARVFAKDFISGDFFCVLDTDDLWMPDKLEKQVAVMLENKDVGIVYTNTIYFTDEGDQRTAYNQLMPSGDLFVKLLENYFFSFETVMVRKSIMDKYNIYFDDSYNVASDAEFFIKLSYYTKCLYLNTSLAKWRYGHGSESDRSLCLFPKEYEILLNQLSEQIDDFNNVYDKSIKILRSKIANMYGVCYWSKGDGYKAREFFVLAIKYNLKYLIPLFLSFIINHDTYRMLKRKFGKV